MAASVTLPASVLLGQAQALPIGIEPRPRAAAVAGFDVDRDVQQQRVGDDAAAELHRRAIRDALGGRVRRQPVGYRSVEARR